MKARLLARSASVALALAAFAPLASAQASVPAAPPALPPPAPAAPPPAPPSAPPAPPAAAFALPALPPGPAAAAVPAAPPPSPDVLTLAEVLRSAEAAYPPLRAAELERDIARADLLSAEGGFDLSWRTRASTTPLGYYQYHRLDTVVEVPTQLWGSTFFAGYRIGRGNIPSYYGELATLSQGEVRGGVNVPLWRNGPVDRRRANVWRAEAGRRVADLGVAQQRLEIARAAAVRYWDWVVAGRRLQIARDLLSLAVARDAGVGTRVARGDLPAFEHADNARAILQRRAQVVAAERGLEGAALELSLFLRGPDGAPRLPDPGRLPTSLPEPDPAAGPPTQEAVAAATRRRPELGRLEALRRQSEVELRWAKNQLMPGLDAQVVASRDFGDGPASLRPTVLEAAVLLDVPLQTRVARGRVDAAEAQIARVDAQSAFARDRISVEVRDALVAMRAARQRVEAARGEVELARQLEQSERARFDLGEGTLLVVNLREQATADAAQREAEALADYHRAVATYRAAAGDGAARP
ncbi:MAG TPA: TolC family protein [Polyangiaceae bacterium]|nr:TolC family protein [Polyangiaceae bacterium]